MIVAKKANFASAISSAQSHSASPVQILQGLLQLDSKGMGGEHYRALCDRLATCFAGKLIWRHSLEANFLHAQPIMPILSVKNSQDRPVRVAAMLQIAAVERTAFFQLSGSLPGLKGPCSGYSCLWGPPTRCVTSLDLNLGILSGIPLGTVTANVLHIWGNNFPVLNGHWEKSEKRERDGVCMSQPCPPPPAPT